MATVIDLDMYKSARIAIHEKNAIVAALDAPPSGPVQWRGYDRTAKPRRTVTVWAQTWVVARSKLAVLLHTSPELVEASRA